MIKNFILRQTNVPLLSKALDVYTLRSKAISSNIANVNTPGYRRKFVTFEEQLQNAVEKTLSGVRSNPHHMPIGRQRITEVQPQLEEDNSPVLKSGANNVDIDREIVEQVKNEIRFVYGARLLANNFKALRASIKGRFDQ